MNYYVFLPLMAFFINLMLGCYVLLKNFKSGLNKLYCLFAFSLTLWSLGDFLTFASATSKEALYWNHLTLLGACLTTVFLLHFFIVFTKSKFLSKKTHLILLYLPALFFIFVHFTTNLITESAELAWWGYEIERGILYIPYTLYLVSYVIIGFFLCYRYCLKPTSAKEKSQIKLLITAIAVPLVGGIMTQIIPVILGFKIIPLTSTLTTITAVIVTYAMFRYELMPRSTPFSIRKKIIASLMLASIIPMVMISATQVNSIDSSNTEINTFLGDELVEHTHEDLFSKTNLLMGAVEKSMKSYLTQFKMASDREIFGRLLLDVNETGVLEDGHFYPNPITENWQKTYNYFYRLYESISESVDMVRMFYKNGYVVAGVVLGEEDILDYKGDKSWFTDVMNTEKISSDEYYISPISIARVTNTSTIRYARPLEVDGERLGLLVINFKASVITDDIQKFICRDKGYAMFVDFNYKNAEGKILDWPVILSRSTNETVYQINESVEASPLFFAEEELNDSGLIEFSEEGKEWLSFYSKVNVSGKNWYVFVNVPKEETYRFVSEVQGNINELQGRTWWTLAISMIVVLFFVSSIGLLFSNSLSKPIIKLRDVAGKIREGELDTKIDIKSNDEIGDLASSFNDMAESLKKQQENLENLVAERTKELETKIDELQRYEKVTVDRELKMIELKKQVQELKLKPSGGK